MTTTAPTDTNTTAPTYSDDFIDKHRYINISCHDWWDYIYDETKERIYTEYGFEVDNIYFSLSYSQGDGACFTGTVRDWGKFLRFVYPPDTNPDHPCHHPLILAHADDYWTLRMENRGSRYTHSRTVAASADFAGIDEDEDYFCDCYPCGPDLEPEPSLTTVATYHLMQPLDADQLLDHCEQALRDLMDDLYRDLTREYEYLTSDEAVIDALIANGITETDE